MIADIANSLLNSVEQLAVNCASFADATCRNLRDLAIQEIGLALKAAESCVGGTNNTCNNLISLVLHEVGSAEATALACVAESNTICALAIETAKSAIGTAEQAALACATLSDTICGPARDLALREATFVLTTGVSCAKGSNPTCAKVFAEAATVITTLEQAVTACATESSSLCQATLTGIESATAFGLPSVDVLGSPVNCPSDSPDENCYAMPIDRYSVGLGSVYYAQDSYGSLPTRDILGSTTTDTRNYGVVRTDNYTGIPFDGVASGAQAGGVAGVDISMVNDFVNGGRSYLPCQNVNDTYHGACSNPKAFSYYRVGNYSQGQSNPFPVGINANNQGDVKGNYIPNCLTADLCTHNWAEKLARIDVEFYPKHLVNNTPVTDFNYVRNRFDAQNFGTTVNAPDNGIQSQPSWGTITEKRLGMPGTGKAYGTIIDASGQPAEKGTLAFVAFESGAHGLSSTGQPLQSFAAFSNVGPSSQDPTHSRFSTGAVYQANFTFTAHQVDPNNPGGPDLACRQAQLAIGASTNLNIDVRRGDWGIIGSSPC